jgi:hypothetical protein
VHARGRPGPDTQLGEQVLDVDRGEQRQPTADGSRRTSTVLSATRSSLVTDMQRGPVCRSAAHLVGGLTGYSPA